MISEFISPIIDLMIELSKEKKTNDPVRDLYSVYQDLAREVGKRMNQMTEDKKNGRL